MVPTGRIFAFIATRMNIAENFSVIISVVNDRPPIDLRSTMSRYIFLLGLLGILTFGCASARTYQVQVNGYTDSAAPLLAPGVSLFVIEEQKAQDFLLEKEIKNKIDNLLVKHGYLLASYDKSQFYMSYTYGLKISGTVTVAGPIGPGCGWEELGHSAYLPAQYGPYCIKNLTLYDRWLRLTVIEEKYYRETGKSRTV
jgi:hypothetical protein